jgi:hypothetical protein
MRLAWLRTMPKVESEDHRPYRPGPTPLSYQCQNSCTRHTLRVKKKNGAISQTDS